MKNGDLLKKIKLIIVYTAIMNYSLYGYGFYRLNKNEI